ncbi:MAG: hypothetical protein Q7J27_04695 [Syntrophales bacterium]|nr:hypothetical protein [Syntrophales bacterium]
MARPLPKICFITHGSPSIGGGHINRCSALAVEVAASGAFIYWLVNSEAELMLHQKGFHKDAIFSLEDPFSVSPEKVVSIMEGMKPDLCVIDSYDATPPFIQKLRERCPVVLIDDCRARPVEEECDVLLNYNLGADLLGYAPGRASLLLGPKYTLLRNDFRGLVPEEGDTILIIPGASDMHNVTESFIRWWKKGWPHAELVLGPLVEKGKCLRLSSMAEKKHNLSVMRDPPDLPERMSKAGAIICTSSVTSYEALSLRKPLAVFQVAENQHKIGEEIARQGLGVNLGKWGSFGQMEIGSVLKDLPLQPSAVVNLRGAEAAARAMIVWFQGRR